MKAAPSSQTENATAKRSRFRFCCLRKWFKVGVFLFAWLFVGWIWVNHPVAAESFGEWRVERIKRELQASNFGINLFRPSLNKNIQVYFCNSEAPFWSRSMWQEIGKAPWVIFSPAFWQKRHGQLGQCWREPLPKVFIGIIFPFGRRKHLPDLTALHGLWLAEINLELTGSIWRNGTWRSADLKMMVNEFKDTQLTQLCLDSQRVSDLTPLQGMPLTSLSCKATKVTDITALKGMPLYYLNLDISKVANITPLKGMALNYLSLQQTQVNDLSPIKGMPLKALYLDNSTEVTDFTPLKGMPLTDLDLQYTQISDLSPLKGMPLTTLLLEETKVSDLTPLTGMPLKDLNLSHTLASDLNPLKGMPLTFLDLRDTPAAKKPLPAWLKRPGLTVKVK